MSIKLGMPEGMSVNPIMSNDRLRRKGIVAFLLLAFIPCWIAWIILYKIGFPLSNPVVQLGTAFMPAVAAFIVRKWITREGFADAGLALRLKPAKRYYAFALILPLLMLALVALFSVVAGQASIENVLTGNTLIFIALAPVIMIVAAPIYWGEEFGWTSYLRMRLTPNNPLRATISTGVIWGVWHWPLVFTGYFEGYDMTKLDNIIGQMVLWVVLCVLLEIILSWSFWKSGSIWTTSILHAGNNLIVVGGSSYVMAHNIDLNMSTALLCLGILPVALCLLVGSRKFLSSKRATTLSESK